MGSQDLALCPLPSLNAKCVVIVDNLRSAFNVGSIFRTSECVFGTVASIVLTGYTVCMCMCVCVCVCVYVSSLVIRSLLLSLSHLLVTHGLSRSLSPVLSRARSPLRVFARILSCFLALGLARLLFCSSASLSQFWGGYN